MRAVVVSRPGGPEVLEVAERPRPAVAQEGILVRVRAAGLNRADLLQRRGRYPAPAGWPADIPGLEYAGEVESVGAGVSRWKPGDRVMGIVGGGACAELVAVHQDEVLAIPASFDFSEAAAIPESFLTAYDALVAHGRLIPGARVLVHAIGSGLGTAAVQVARALDATVIGTSRTPSKLEAARSLGLDQGIDSSSGFFAAEVREPVDIILDVIGAPAWSENLKVLASRGRLVLLGFLGASRGELDLEPVLRKRMEIIGSLMRPRDLGERSELVARAGRELMPLFESGELRPVVARRFPMERVREAHREMEGNDVFGKIVLEW
ncbi:MAG TPA: NAD(P)H-quinone oxidoreductase [Gemmatimonadales bacterium]|nr:NAD(P)H-quinone oxidoreductase [Gemmatimonadales bacterium]